ncbi:MFS general substrate transporter [Irpex rosettiformis]|uniref:MFS general substrate transporter n=1 Tax=Irpex rosettiformis TaxID=378272 RepID=A0ACB8UBL0_9APHY|nr:MFS general substrate transporter [Irpex rosettiformis]
MSKSEEATLNGSQVLERYHLVEGLVSSDPADPRITNNTRATPHDTKAESAVKPESIASEPEKEDGPKYIDFVKDDPRDPLNFSIKRKWTITMCAIFSTGLCAANASTYNLGFPSMIKDLNCTQFQATIGLSTYALGFAITPLITTSFSEEFGRHPLYIVSNIIYGLMHLMVALAQNIQTVQIARFISGVAGSAGSAMVGGTIADLFLPHERGIPMSMLSVAAVGITGFGPVIAGWTEMGLGWRWIQWISFIITMVYAALIPILMRETRSAVVLTRIAKKLRKESGDHRYRARVEDERASLRNLIWISCTRPFYLMITEPVVASFSIWIGFAWGISYVLIESIGPVFRTLHSFNSGETGLVFITFLLGSIFGLIIYIYVQEPAYRKYHATRGPEARLYTAMGEGVCLAGSLFMYAWCTFPSVPWITLCIAITLTEMSSFTIYLAVFTYLADCYGTFASSALAGQSLSRNLFGMAFPLFTAQMYDKLTYHWANTMFAFLALAMAPVPFSFFKGPVLRARSKFAKTAVNT